MSKKVLAIFLLLLVALVGSGCKDITDSFKPGSFGASALEKTMIEALTQKHGDLRESGSPRFLETMMTSKVDKGMPIDRVSKYSKAADKLYVWFVYDNFNEDMLEIEWVYLPNNHSIHTFKSQTGKDFGRGTFILEKPNDGWPTGAYKVIIRGRGITSTVNFEIIDGQTVSEPIMLPGGKVELPRLPGWHLVGWDYLINPLDTSKQSNGYHNASNLMGTTSKLYDYIEGKGDKNSFTISVWRNGADGKRIAGSTSTSTWEDPPAYMEPGKKIALQVTRAYNDSSTWGQNGIHIKFDSSDLPSGSYTTSSSISFVDPSGKNYLHAYSGKIETAKAIPNGKPGDKKAIWVALDGYSFKYTYEWRD